MRVGAIALLVAIVASCGAPQQPATQSDQNSCGAKASPVDAQGWLTGASPNTTTIRVLTPRVMRAGSEVLLYWYMTSGPGTARLTVYAEGPTGARTVPRAIDDVFTGSLVTQDDYIVFLTFPEAGCWRLRGERANGKTFGDVWLSVAPR